MKIIGISEFLQLPAGTLFSQYGYLCIKGETIRDTDFFYEGITPGIAECADAMTMMGLQRWGELDDTAMFAVFDEEDIEKLLAKLGGGRSAVR